MNNKKFIKIISMAGIPKRIICPSCDSIINIQNNNINNRKGDRFKNIIICECKTRISIMVI